MMSSNNFINSAGLRHNSQPSPHDYLNSNAYWLMKSEPDVFSIDDLESKKSSLWDGVRNYQARNYMQKSMSVGDYFLFYHSNAKPSGVAGIGRVTGAPQVDPTAFDKKTTGFDPKSKKENPTWFCVEVSYVAKTSRFVALEEIKINPKLKDMVLLHNSRLSVQPVQRSEFFEVLRLAGLL